MDLSRRNLAILLQTGLAGLFVANFRVHDDRGLLPSPWETLLLICATALVCLFVRLAALEAGSTLSKRLRLGCVGPVAHLVLIFVVWRTDIFQDMRSFVACTGLNVIVSVVLFVPVFAAALVPRLARVRAQWIANS